MSERQHVKDEDLTDGVPTGHFGTGLATRTNAVLLSFVARDTVRMAWTLLLVRVLPRLHALTIPRFSHPQWSS